MRITFLQSIFIMLFVGLSYARDLAAQEIMERRVSLSKEQTKIESILTLITKQTQARFVYSYELIEADRLVSIQVKNQPLQKVLESFLPPLGIGYRVSSTGTILLKRNWPKHSFEMVPIEEIIKPVDHKVSGRVTDEKGEALPGVSVLLKGTQMGVTTNFEGRFALSVPNTGGTLVFSFVGYVGQEIEINKQSEIDVVLPLDQKSLEEVVVVGYGVQKKKDITGSISSVDAEMFQERKETQVSQALQGAMSGVLVSRNAASGTMGGASILIRGVTTIGNSDPLVIVDGVPVSDVNQINPNDIENLTVLKDAASASIYGSRAAAGVILITSKRAKTDQTSIKYNFETGFDTPTQIPKYYRAVDYMKGVNELRWNDAGNGNNRFPVFTEDLLENYDQKHLDNPDQYPDTDWMGLTFKKTIPRQSHNISVNAGSKAVKSNASIRYEKVGGLYDNKDYERVFLRSNNDFSINKVIGGTVDFYFKRTNTSDPTAANPIRRAMISAPIYPAVWADGRIADGKAGENVYGTILYGGSDDTHYTQIGGRIALYISPVKDLKLSAILAPRLDFNNQKRFNKRVDAYASDDPDQYVASLIGGGLSTRLDENRTSNSNITTQLLLNYSKTLGAGDFTGLLGYENYYFKSEYMGASRDQYLFDTYPYLDQGPVAYRDNFGSAYETAYRSFFGRLTYNYKDKYLVQTNIRRDGSSRFNKKYRWGVFPSVSVGWVLSEESFLQSQKLFSYLKLRASWGALGNERIGNYPSVGIMNFSNVLFYQNNVAISQQTAAQVQYAIEDISWEKTTSTNIGLDAYFLKNRLHLTTDVYEKRTKDMLLALQIPIFVGFENPNQNTGLMKTRGIDIDLGWRETKGDFTYSASVNLSQYKSVMGDLGGTEFLGDKIKKEGSQFDEWYGYISEGIYQTQEDVDNSPKLSDNAKVGDLKYRDISGPDGMPDGKISPEYDRVLLGSSQPQWIYGGNLRMAYKNIDLGITFQGIGYQNSSSLAYTEYNAENFGNFPAYLKGKTWSALNSADENLNAAYPRLTETNKGLNRTMSDFWLFNGGYLRLKNVAVGYTLPKKITDKISSSSARIYLNASDLFSLSKYPKGWDPEGTGIVSTYTMGVSIGF
ncbi:TonB-dependent receptor [Marinilongibacter aquaticus]|uniref:TonB-dependent receptor n=1 Tax=Marinilongibacter aquaticus TaxID=2975157 RepID=UPI0021BD56EC|nr:TonB-dependent receptor [Marinilongibacter aquaticus]UBM58662.1 TonB-dependent receptor [Marinilongibacter aquaticus]